MVTKILERGLRPTRNRGAVKPDLLTRLGREPSHALSEHVPMARILLAFVMVASMTLLSLAAPAPKAPPPKADDKMVPGPWYSAKVGDVLLKRDSLNQSSTWKITKVDDTTVTI